MLSIALCDDEEIFLNLYEQRVRKYMNKFPIEYRIEKYCCGEDLLNSNIEYDFYFLDIQLPGIKGIKLAESIREKYGSKAFIVFVTSDETTVYDSFMVDAAGFVRKHNMDCDFENTMERIVKKWIKTMTIYEFSDGMKKIYKRAQDIMFIEVFGHKMILNCVSDKFEIRETIGEIIKKLPKEEFAEPHRGFIINYQYVDYIEGDGVYMKNGIRVPLSRRKNKEVRNDYVRFLRRTAGV